MQVLLHLLVGPHVAFDNLSVLRSYLQIKEKGARTMLNHHIDLARDFMILICDPPKMRCTLRNVVLQPEYCGPLSQGAVDSFNLTQHTLTGSRGLYLDADPPNGCYLLFDWSFRCFSLSNCSPNVYKRSRATYHHKVHARNWTTSTRNIFSLHGHSYYFVQWKQTNDVNIKESYNI